MTLNAAPLLPLTQRAHAALILLLVDLTLLPGHELIVKGIADLQSGQSSAEAFLVAIGAARLRRAGVAVPDISVTDPEHRLYEMLAQEDPDAAHSKYNALIRQLVSFERAAECAA